MMNFFRPRGQSINPQSEWIWLDPNPTKAGSEPINLELARTFSEATCRALSMIPVAIEGGGLLTIAVADGADADHARKAVMDLAQTAVAVVFCERQQLDRALNRVFDPVERPFDPEVESTYKTDQAGSPFSFHPHPSAGYGIGPAPESASALSSWLDQPETKPVEEDAFLESLDPFERLIRSLDSQDDQRSDDQLMPDPPGSEGLSFDDPPEAEGPRRPVAEPGKSGALFVEQGLINSSELALALEYQQRAGGRIGEILVHEQVVSEGAVTEALSEFLDVPFVELDGFDPDPEAVEAIPEWIQHESACLPLWIDDEQGELHLAMVDPRDTNAWATLEEHTALEIVPYLAQPGQLTERVSQVHRADYEHAAREMLIERFPQSSARQVMSQPQKLTVIIGLITIGTALALAPGLAAGALIVAAAALYLVVTLHRLRHFHDRPEGQQAIVVDDSEALALDERTMPVYSILVPLYDEASVVPQLLANLSEIEYPRPRIEILLLVEADDDATAAAIERFAPPPHFRVVTVPDGTPKTKPKACNYGLMQARGQFVVVYDAEDRPDPLQLKKVLIAWNQVEQSVICLQCKLAFFNANDNLLTKILAAEYALQFDHLKPGLDQGGAMIPLGGTSNHFHRDSLIEVGGWDPYNVAEYADLGVRLQAAGYSNAVLESTTLEEATSRAVNWIRQRSRWVKGCLQTYLVHMRHPLQLASEIGWRSWWSFQLVFGGAAVLLLNPILWALTTFWLVTQVSSVDQFLPSIVFHLSALLLLVGNFVFAYVTIGAFRRHGFPGIAKYAPALPIYWGLMSIGAWRGFLQLFSRPFYWEKSDHGLDHGHLADDLGFPEAR